MLISLVCLARPLASLSAVASTRRLASTTGATAAPDVPNPQGSDARIQSALSHKNAEENLVGAAASAVAHAGARIPLAHPALSVWGANTNVGKTLASVGLAHAAAKQGVALSYVKPVQTGFPEDSDARLVALACGGVVRVGPHAAETAALASAGEGERANAGGSGVSCSADGADGPGCASPPSCTTLFAWRHAVSPHLAVRLEGRGVSDEDLAAATAVHVQQELDELARVAGTDTGLSHGAAAADTASAGSGRNGVPATAGGRGKTATASGGDGSCGAALLLLETAGGVTSPAPSGRLTCDVLRPLRLPALLVGDPRLGGIAATLSAYDSLISRGWDVEAVVLVGQHSAPQVSTAAGGGDGAVPLDNLSFLRQHFHEGPGGGGTVGHRLGGPPPEVVGLPACAPPPQGHSVREHGLDPSLRAWLAESLPALSELLAALQRRHARRVAALLEARAAAESRLWWPFTQHAGLTHGSATIVDGRCGETWTALAAPPAAAAIATAAELVPLYDASGSWWTQAATPALQPAIARAVSYAAARYLHVLFAEVAHAPALAAAEALLAGPGAGWAARVFFSDDGSTAVEVALKMAFRKFLADRGELSAAEVPGGGAGGELLILGLQGAYHGDTLGAQDCVAPSVFNGPLQSPWYRGRGLFLEPPYVGMHGGRWRILDPPAWLSRRHSGELQTWGSLEELLSYGSGGGGAAAADQQVAMARAAAYRSYIESAIDEFEAAAAAAAAATAAGRQGARLAACIMEPLLQGAGGMLVVDPEFQRAMAEVCRSRRLPLILDEVFSGLYRSGALTAAAALGITPDVACYGKLLTGGAAPMAVTLASREVFEAFSGPSKLFALLHGHSYTAYPVGCAATVAALELLSSPETNPNLCAPCRCPKSPRCTAPCGRLLPLWDEQREVSELSYHPLVSRVVAVGTVLAVELATATASSSSSGGYTSVSSVQVVRRLRDAHGIYARPLGSVVYLMVPPTARRETAAWLAASLRAALDWCAGNGGGAASASATGGGRPEGRVPVTEEGVVV